MFVLDFCLFIFLQLVFEFVNINYFGFWPYIFVLSAYLESNSAFSFAINQFGLNFPFG